MQVKCWDIFHAIGKASKQMQAKKAFRLQYRTYRIYGCWKDKYFRIFKKHCLQWTLLRWIRLSQKREGMSIPEYIFEVHGEQYFRDLETKSSY